MPTDKRDSTGDGPAHVVEHLIDAAFRRVQQLGTSADIVSLFPNGLESLQFDVDSSAGSRISVTLKGRPGPAGGIDETRTLLGGDVEAAFNAEGHEVIALIAQADLLQPFPTTMTKVQRILDDGGRDLLTAAIFPAG